ncbi:MAG: IclR family transcriptional regulator [Rhizobiales bacterium]|nr:IclR family transcriptional regulator [Hyphomicrobiales bacterium]
MPKKPDSSHIRKDEKLTYLSRVFGLLQFLAERSGNGARVPEISERMGIHRVTAHRLLRTLTALGYVEQGPDLSYRLGFETWFLGFRAGRQFAPARVAAAMKRVSEASEESVFLMRRAGNEGICIGEHQGTFPVRSLVMRVGERRVLGVGGTSVAVLAGLPPEEASRLIERNAPEYTRYSITADDVRRFVEEARQQGYAYSRGVVVAESRTLGVPLSLTGDSMAAMSMSIVTLESRLSGSRRAMLIGLLQNEAAALAAPHA